MDKVEIYNRFSTNYLEIAGRSIEKAYNSDNYSPSFLEKTGIANINVPTVSGLSDQDYPNLAGFTMGILNLDQMGIYNKIPLPPEIIDQFEHVKSNTMMGLFPEINRAWLTIDSDIYIWTYEQGCDVSYFDGLNATIYGVGLIKPKPGVFSSFVKYLLVLTTLENIVVLGVTFTSNLNLNEMQLLPEPVFTVPTDGVRVMNITGTSDGRLFFAGKNGSLYEIIYQADATWFGKRIKKVNHSSGLISYIMPSFLYSVFNESDPIIQMAVDNYRHILYTLTEKGNLDVYDLGASGNNFYYIARFTHVMLCQQATEIVRALDAKNFHPIVNISAIEMYDSNYVHLVAVTHTGIRLYFTTINLHTSENQRPNSIRLLHVRVPPGFSANIPTLKPTMVRMANIRDNNFVFVSTAGNNVDQLWCVNSDLFPFTNSIVEAYSILSLDGTVQDMQETIYWEDLPNFSSPLPPLVVRQHIDSTRKYIILTNRGVHIFWKPRPVDLLRRLLVNSSGPDSDSVRIYFQLIGEDQACATCLILACLEETQNYEIAEWATRAFFMYGGEPTLLHTTVAPGHLYPQGNTSSDHKSDLDTTPLSDVPSYRNFNPEVVSTPLSSYSFGRSSSQSQTITEPITSLQRNLLNATYDNTFNFSPKHNGLYLYISRILRPIWNSNCTKKITTDDNKENLTSTITSDDCIWILNLLLPVKSFFQRNTQISLVGHTNQYRSMSVRGNHVLQDMQLEERQSLDALKNFIIHSCEVLHLWKVLCEHNISLLIPNIPQDIQRALEQTCFKDLLIFGHTICSALIVSLINSYLGDNASVDAISSTLRNVCPNLYRAEDAACSKANELLLQARTIQNVDEKNALLHKALQLYKDVAPNLNINAACQKFVNCQCYEAVIELCITSAKKVDPENIAEHYFKMSEPSEEYPEEYQIFAKRMDIYKEVINVLNTLYTQNKTFSSDTVDTSNIQKMQDGKMYDPNEIFNKIMTDILNNFDELLHVALYEWMLNKEMFEDLLNIKELSLENYLVRAAQQTPFQFKIFDLLWKYYEKNGKHTEAANILKTLVEESGTNLNLIKRIEYLSRAVMCMRNDSVGYSANFGVFLRELEDKIDIAKIQQQILTAIVNEKSSLPNAADAVQKLNSYLFEVTELYENFAVPFKLWECQLSIIHCSGHNDPLLIQNIWKNIINTEESLAKGTSDEKMTQILNKIHLLSKYFRDSELCFPLEFLIRYVEDICYKLQANYRTVPSGFASMEISLNKLITVYYRILILNERVLNQEENGFHLFKAFTELINIFLCNSEQMSALDKKKTTILIQDVIAGLLSTLYSKPQAEEIVKIFKKLQAKLKRL